jgi:hypothetical protein
MVFTLVWIRGVTKSFKMLVPPRSKFRAFLDVNSLKHPSELFGDLFFRSQTQAVNTGQYNRHRSRWISANLRVIKKTLKRSFWQVDERDRTLKKNCWHLTKLKDDDGHAISYPRNTNTSTTLLGDTLLDNHTKWILKWLGCRSSLIRRWWPDYVRYASHCLVHVH